MALGMIVPTKFTLQDNMSPRLKTARGNMEKFAVGARAAFRSIIPEASRLNDIIKGVAIGNLLSKGITIAMRAIRQNIGSAIDYASNIIEVRNVVKTVFGESEDSINSFAKSAMNSFGLTELQAKKFSSTIGAVFKGMGISGAPMVEMSKNITAVAGDLASFYNLTQEDAFEKLRSGLTGQTAPLKQIGIVMDQTSLEAFALSKGIKSSWKEMNQAAKTALRYQFIMEKTALAQGDYAKPIPSYAVSSRNLTNTFEEMKGKLATGLIPALIKTADHFTGLFRKVGNWADANQKTISATFLSFVRSGIAAIGTIIGWVKSGIAFFDKFGPAILGAYAAFTVFSTVTTMINGVTVALGAMGVALHIAAGPIGFIAAALAAIGVALGVVVMKSKLAAAGGSAAAENRYREAARMMVAENEATRIQQERNNVKQPFTSPRAADSVQQRNDTRQSFTSPKAAAFAKTTAGMARREAARQAGVLDETARENLSKAQLIAVSGLRSDPYTVAISSSMNKQADAAFAARQEEIEKLKNKPRRYQIHSSLVNEFGPLSLDEALQVQARKWSNEDRFNRTTLRGSELTNYVAANPDEITYQEALRRLREDAANESAEDNGMDPEMRKYLDDFEEWFKKLNDGLNKETEKIPGRIQYSAMGKEDFWELARAGL